MRKVRHLVRVLVPLEIVVLVDDLSMDDMYQMHPWVYRTSLLSQQVRRRIQNIAKPFSVDLHSDEQCRHWLRFYSYLDRV